MSDIALCISHCPGEHLAVAQALGARLRREFPALALHPMVEADDDDDDDADADAPPALPPCADAGLLVAMVGPFWLERGSSRYRTEADRERERVRTDLAQALRRGAPVVLLRTAGAQVPPAHHLPPELRPLAEGAAVTLAFDDPPQGLPALLATLHRMLEGRGPDTVPEAHAAAGPATRWPVWLGPAAAGLVLALAAWWAAGATP